jgi:hypothetical protein
MNQRYASSTTSPENEPAREPLKTSSIYSKTGTKQYEKSSAANDEKSLNSSLSTAFEKP